MVLRRAADVTDKTLYVSPPIGLDRMLLALLALMELAWECKGLKTNLLRDKVPITPPGGYRRDGLGSSMRQQGGDRQHPVGEVVGQMSALGSGRKAGVASSSSDGSSGNRVSSSDGGSGSKNEGEWLYSSTGFLGHFEQLEEEPEEEQMLPVFSLRDVGFTSLCVALGRHGPLLQVRLSVTIAWHSMVSV